MKKSKPCRQAASLILLVMLGLFLAACSSDPAPLPTNAPHIPSPSLPPSRTPTPLLNIVTPQVSNTPAPSWTPSATRTPAPSRSPQPTPTPRPSATLLPQPTPGVMPLEGGGLRLTLAAEELNTAFADQPYTPQFMLAPTGLSVILHIPNAFLGETSRVTAAVTITLTAEGVVLTLEEFSFEGPTITREQVRDLLPPLAAHLNDLLIPRFTAVTPAANGVEFLRYELAFGFLIIEMRAK